MSISDPAASSLAAPQMPHSDTQHLIALLSSLMPLLARMQQQTLQPAGALGPTVQAGQSGVVLSNAALDHQAAVSLVEDITASSLSTLSAYLENNAAQNAELQSSITFVTQAARCFSGRDYAQAFGLIWETYRAITMARAANPQLPPLRTAGRGASATPAASAAQFH
jgi:hypothetical protein